MLVLSRKKNEKVIVDLSQLTPAQLAEMQANGTAKVSICIVEIRGDKTRLGLDVPRAIPCHREEVYDSILRNGSRKAS